jgi:hypothetical protein
MLLLHDPIKQVIITSAASPARAWPVNITCGAELFQNIDRKFFLKFSGMLSAGQGRNFSEPGLCPRSRAGEGKSGPSSQEA